MTRARRPIEQWNAIRDEFVRGDDTFKDLAIKHEVNRSTLVSRARREDWKAQRDRYRQKRESQANNASDRALELSMRSQAETRVQYAERARRLANLITTEAERLVDSGKARSIELQRLAGAFRTVQQVEFAALGIAADTIQLTDDDDGKLATWEEHMNRQRQIRGLEPYPFGQ